MRGRTGRSGRIAIVATVIFKRVSDGRPYPEHGLRTRDWAQVLSLIHI